MADNLQFPILFDLEKGVEAAIKEWDGKYADKLEKAIQKRALNVKLKFDTTQLDSLDAVKTRLAQLKIEPITPETKSAIKELASELRTLAKALEQVKKYAKNPTKGAIDASKVQLNEQRAKAQAALAAQRAAKAEDNLAAARLKAARAANVGTSATRNANKAFAEQSSYLSRLTQRMAAYWSIRQVGNFLTNVREVTAQFELQRVSLGAILQDANKGEQIFSQIKQFALSSPLSILDLTKYTKQLAAYKIEYDELFDMTKRLADISVGIGADFQRIVLAAGQTRTATYLRASELKQFTELSVPLLEELSIKLSKMNGEMVTTAEVMDLISQRAISWELVKEVLYDMTDAGGMFYDMQVKQSQTLYGLWQKLGDAASVMYAQIGETSFISSGMKEAIQMLTELMRNWKAAGITAATTILPAVAAMAAWKMATKALAKSVATATSERIAAEAKLATAMKGTDVAAQNAARSTLAKAKADEAAAIAAQKHTTAIGKLKMGLVSLGKTLAAGLGISIVIALIIELIYKISEAVTNFHKLENELGAIYTETFTLQDQSVRNFEFLADKAVKAANGSKEQKDALDELSRTYRDILPQEALTIENLARMKGNYDALTQSIKEYIAEQQRQKAESNIYDYYNPKISESQGVIRERLLKQGVSATEIGRFFVEFQKEGDDVFLSMEDKFRDAMEKAGVKSADKIKQIWDKEFAMEPLGQPGVVLWVNKKLGLNSAYNDLVNLNEAYHNQAAELEGLSEQYHDITGEYGAFAEKIKQAKEELANIPYTNPDGSAIDQSTILFQQIKDNNAMKKAAQLIREDEDLPNAIRDKEVEWNDAWIHLVESVDPDDLFDITTIDFDAMIKAVEEKYPDLANRIKMVQKEWGNVAPTNATAQQIKVRLFQITQSFGLAMDDMRKYLWDGSGDVDAYLERLKEQQDNLKKRLKEKQNALLQMGILSKWWNKLMGKDIEAEVEQMKKEISALDQQIAFTTEYTIPDDKKSNSHGGSKSDPRLQTLQEIANKMAEVNKEYDELLKKEGKTKALADTQKLFASSFKQMQATADKYGFKLPVFEVPQTIEDAQKWYKAIMDNINRLGIKNADKVLIELGFKSDKAAIDKQQKDIEKQLKELADRISRTKTAKEFYEKILRLTRNEGLAFQATFSVYGKDTLDTFTDEVEQLKQNFGKIDITAAINLKTKQIDYKALREIWEADKALPDNLRKIPQDYDSAIKSILDAGDKLSERQRERWGKDLERAREYADKRIELAQYTATQIAEIEAKRDSLDPKSENYAAQVAMYDQMISGYREREKNKAAKLDYEQIKEQIGMFDDLGVRIGTAFESILTQLREYTKSPDFARLGLEAQKNVYQQIAKIEDRMAEGFQGIGIGTVSEYVRQYSTAASEYLIAQNNLRDATLKAIEADKEWERVKNSNNEAAKSAALADKTLADSRVQTAAASVNVAGANLQRAQEGAARASAKFDSNLQKVESSLKSLNNGALKALWDLIGDKGKRSVGEFLSGSRKILSALDKLTKALADSGSDMGKLSTTIATNLATALQNINPDDTEAIAKAATDSLKTTLSSVISDKGVVDLLANTLSKNIGEIASQALSGVLSTEDAAKKVGALIDGVADAASKTGEMWGAIISLILSLLDEFAENGIGTFLGELLDNIADAVEGILANLLTDSLPKILGSVGNVVKGVGTGLANMLTFGVFDITGAKRIKKANKEIKRQQELLEQLEYTYGRLEKAADKVFGADYAANQKQRQKILLAQQQAYMKQYEAEMSKGKKADEEKAQEFLDKARDIGDQIADMQGKIAEQMLGTDITSAARDFAKAWLDAYKQFGNTADAMSEKFHEMIENMIVESLMAKAMQRALEPAFKMIDEMDEGDFYSEDFWRKVMETADQGSKDANAAGAVIMEWAKKWGYDGREKAEGFTGIAKSVAGATSEEINNVAAIGNTLMYYVSPIPRIDENLARVVALMEGRGAALSVASGVTSGAVDYTDLFNTANQHLSSLPRMEQHLAEIHTMLGRALRTKGSTTGFNTFLNS